MAGRAERRSPIIRSAELGAGLRTVIATTGGTGRAFRETVARVGGPLLDAPTLTRLQSGERGLQLRQWHDLVAAMRRGGMDSEAVDELESLLPDLMLIDPLPPESPAQVVQRLVAMTEAALAADPDNSPVRRMAEHLLTDERDTGQRFEAAVRRVVDIVRAGGGAPDIDPSDQVSVEWLDPQPVYTTTQERFHLTVRLHNSGRSWWRNRLLLRLGPLTTSTLAMTPPLLPVPDTEAGAACQIAIHGRAQYIPCVCVIHYIMITGNGARCLPGGLAITVSAHGNRLRTHTVPGPVATLLRAGRGRR